MKTRVYLATTRGPVQVERISWEPAAQSAICLRRTTKVLAISPNYDAFVRHVSGVIEREFGSAEGGAFRLDVSGEVDAGDSWQLGVYAAHALHAKGRLAGPNDKYDHAIWLTGKLNADLDVGAVTHLSEKLQASRDEFARLQEMGVPVSLYVPKDNAVELTNADLDPGTEVRGIKTGHELLEKLAIVVARSPSEGKSITPIGADNVEVKRPGYLWRNKIFAAVPIAIFLAAGFAWYQGMKPHFDTWNDLTQNGEISELNELLAGARSGSAIEKTAAAVFELWTGFDLPPKLLESDTDVKVGTDATAGIDDTSQTPTVPAPLALKEVTLTVSARRPPAQGSCAGVQFAGVEPVVAPFEVVGPGQLRPVMIDDLCGIDFQIDPGGSMYISATVVVISGRFLDGSAKPAALDGRSPLTKPVSWHVTLPRRLRAPMEYLVVVAASESEIRPAVVIEIANSARRGNMDQFTWDGIELIVLEQKVMAR
jgi:hypothetical protein